MVVLDWLMWLLLVSIIVFVEYAVNVYQMVGKKVKRCHLLVFCSFAMPIHFWDVVKHREIAHR